MEQVRPSTARGTLDPMAFLLRHAIFTTRAFALATARRLDSASRWLGRMTTRGVVVRVTRGVWAQPDHPDFTPHAATGLVLGNEVGYVSLISALHRHGILSQIPGAIHVATTGHGRVLESPIARYEFYQFRPAMMTDGIDMSLTDPPYGIAGPEKAVLDTHYIATRRGNRYRRLPELDLSDIDWGRLRELLRRQVTARPIRKAIERRLGML